jgi:hypothetical protein
MALATYTKQGQWLTQTLRDLRLDKYVGTNLAKVQIYRDNQGVIALTKNPHLYE